MTPALALGLVPFLSLDVAAERIAILDGISRTFPQADSGLPQPRNLRLLAFGTVSSPPVFTLTRGDDSVVAVESQEVDATTSFGGRSFALPLPELVAGEAITLEAACDSCAGQSTFNFTIGDELDELAPAFGDGTGRFTFTGGVGGNGYFGRTGFEVELCVPPVLAEEAVMLRMSGDELDRPHLGVPGTVCTDGSSGLATSFRIDGGEPRDICVDVVAIDVAGQESAPITVCGALEASEGGCAASPTPTVAMAGLLLLLRRRRR